MLEPRHAARQWVSHWLRCEGRHSIHSPFLFRFFEEVLHPATSGLLEEVEDKRRSMRHDRRLVDAIDPGTGTGSNPRKELRAVVKNEVAGPELAAFYRRLVRFMKAGRVLEIGTSVGLTTLYLSADGLVSVTTLEANREVASAAEALFTAAGRKNIRLVSGDADDTLPRILHEGWVPEVAIIDANHRLEPTLNFFNLLADAMGQRGVIVVDDIHYSREMTSAWNRATHDRRVSLSLDCYRFGVLFLDHKIPRASVQLEVPFNLIRS